MTNISAKTKKMNLQKPINLKTIYHSFSDLYEKVMNDKIPIEKAKEVEKSLSGKLRTFNKLLARKEK